MALTKISTAGVKDDIVTTAKIADDAVTEALISDDSVDEARLKISNAGSNGQVLTKQSGNTGGLTWADAAAGVGGSTGVDFNDSVKARWGTGNDLEIYHDGSHSRLADVGTGSLIISGSTLSFLNQAKNETLAEFTENGAVNLYYDNSKKFETTSWGNQFHGGLRADDSTKIQLGTGNDLQIYHDGSNSLIKNTTGNLVISDTNGDIWIQAKDGEHSIVAHADGSVKLYHNNAAKFETASNGIQLLDELGLNDAKAAMFGDSDDMKIYHDGTHSYIWNTQGDLQIRGDHVYICSVSGEGYLEGTSNGSTKIFYDNSTKLETTSAGVSVTGNIYQPDDGVHYFGSGNDLYIFHDGTNSYINNLTGNLEIRVKSGEAAIHMVPNGTTKLYYDGAKKLETTAAGVTITGSLDAPNLGGNMSTNGYNINFPDSNSGIAFRGRAKFGNGEDLLIFHDGSHSYISNSTNTLYIRSADTYIQDEGGNETNAKFINNGAVELYYDNSEKFRTISSGCKVSAGNLYLDRDSAKVIMGAGDDLHIFHDGNNNYIYGTTNCFTYICTNNTARWSWSNDGHFRPEANNTYDIGSSSQRVRDIYTNDLNLSNEGSTNSVDGTWGNYTIQEGEDDLFLINRRNGKKYKFNLTEVS